MQLASAPVNEDGEGLLVAFLVVAFGTSCMGDTYDVCGESVGPRKKAGLGLFLFKLLSTNRILASIAARAGIGKRPLRSAEGSRRNCYSRDELAPRAGQHR